MLKRPRHHAYYYGRPPSATDSNYQQDRGWGPEKDGYRQRKRNWDRDRWDSDCWSDTTMFTERPGLRHNVQVPEEFVRFVRESENTTKGDASSVVVPQRVHKEEVNTGRSVAEPTISKTQTLSFDPPLAPKLSSESSMSISRACGTDPSAEREVLIAYKHWVIDSLNHAQDSNDTASVAYWEGLLDEVTEDLEDVEATAQPSPTSSVFESEPSISSQPSSRSGDISICQSPSKSEHLNPQPAPSREAQHTTPELNSPLADDAVHHSRSTSSQTQTTESAMSDSASKTENDQLIEVQRLRQEADQLREQIQSEYDQFGELERNMSEDDQSLMKRFEVQLAEQPADDSVKIDRKVAYAVHQMMRRARDESGPRLEDLRQRLFEKEKHLAEVEARLHDHYRPMERCLVQMAKQSERRRYSESQGNESVFEENDLAIQHSRYLYSGQHLQDNNDFQSEPEPLKIFDPSRYHEDYVKLKVLEGHIKMWEEDLNWLRRREIKLLDENERREGVDLHLLDEDEEMLATLPSRITKLEADLEEKHEELGRLFQACLMAGVIYENGEPVEELEMSEDGEGGESVDHGYYSSEADHDEDLIYPTPGRHYRVPAAEPTPPLSPAVIPPSDETSSNDDLFYPTPGRLYENAAADQIPPPMSTAVSVSILPTSAGKQPEPGDNNAAAGLPNEDGHSPISRPAQVGLLMPPNQAPSRTSGPTQFALSAVSRAQSSSRDSEPEDGRIDTWLLEKLKRSQSEVKLLATIIQATGAPLLRETADLVTKFWNHGYHGGTKIKTMPPESVKSIVLQEGYDIALVQQLMEQTVENDWQKIDFLPLTADNVAVGSEVAANEAPET